MKKLRLKFVLIAMASVTAVLAAVLCGINVANYIGINRTADRLNEILLGNGGRFPSVLLPGMSAETPYETRYFSVRLTGRGSLFISDMSQVAAIDGDTAVALTRSLAESGKTNGRHGNYKYAGATLDDGSTLYVFVDMSRSLSTFSEFLTMSILVGIFGLFAVLILVIVLSGVILRPVEESYRKQRAFITNITHDLKTPLTVINAETEMIEMSAGESEWTTDIKKQVKRLGSLTEKLVLLSRMEESGALDIRTFDVSAALSDTVASYAAPAAARGLELDADIKQGVEYSGDPERMIQAFALLLDNAVKYSCGGKIGVSLKKTGKGIEIAFTNSASGMKKGAHNELFERFYRADSSRSSSGNGIGLSVVSAIVKAHKGTASAFSPEDGVFTITLVL